MTRKIHGLAGRRRILFKEVACSELVANGPPDRLKGTRHRPLGPLTALQQETFVVPGVKRKERQLAD
jgi:hypothetical protein